MRKATTAFLILAMAAIASCQLFNDIIPQKRGGAKSGGFQKTINFDSIKLSDRPKAKNGYLPPVEEATYLPPSIKSSTQGPTYLPPVTKPTPPRPTYTYMPSMGTFPTYRTISYSTRLTTTRKPMPPPKPLPTLTTTRRTTTGYYYNKPVQEFLVEDLRRG